MVRIKIKNSQDVVTNQADFETQQLCLEWLNTKKMTGAFGPYSGWFPANELTQEQISAAVDSAEIPNPYPTEGEPPTITIYRLPDSFSYVLEDVTAEYAQAAKEKLSALKIQFGSQMTIYLNALHNDKIDSGVWTEQVISAFMADATIATIERLLRFGALEMSFAIITNTDLSAFYTSQEKTLILDKLNSYILGLGN